MKALILTSGGLIAARIVSAWLGAGHSVAAMWIGAKTPARFLRRDRALGLLAPSWSISAMARRYKFPVARNPNLSGWAEAETEIARLDADVLITAITHQIVPSRILAQFPGRAVNFHPAALPHYRGPSPRIGMLLDGKAELYGGVTLHCLARGIDEGEIIGLREVPYDATRGFIDWDVRLARAAADLARSELQDFLRGRLRPRAQEAKEGSYRKVRKDERNLSEAHSAARSKYICDRFAGSGWIRFRSGHDERYIVSRFIGEVGPRTFEAPQIGKNRIVFDAADARIAVARPRAFAPLAQLLNYWRAIARPER